MSARQASNPQWPLVWEIMLGVAFAVLVAVGVVTVVVPELAEPPHEPNGAAHRGPGTNAPPPTGTAPAGPAGTAPPSTP